MSHHVHAVSMSCAALIGLAVPTVGQMGAASAAPSPWQPVHEEASEVIEDLCPNLTVLWEITADGMWRYTTRGPNDLPLYEEHVNDIEVYTNLANNESVTVLGTRLEHPLNVTDNGDGTLTYLYVHTGQSVMSADDGQTITRLFTGSIVIEKTFDHAGTPTDPSDDQFVGLNFPNGFNSTGPSADFCTALLQAVG
jgi:hypothetical protein